MILPLTGPARVPYAVVAHAAMHEAVLDLSISLPRPSEVGLVEAVMATVDLSRALVAQAEARGGGSL